MGSFERLSSKLAMTPVAVAGWCVLALAAPPLAAAQGDAGRVVAPPLEAAARTVPTEIAAPAKAAAPAPTERTPPPGSVTFDVPFPAEKGGGSARGWAGGIRYQQEDVAELYDGVEIRYQDVDIRADRVEVDLGEKIVRAFGNVILDQGPRRLSGTSLTFDLETKTGTVTNASAYVDPDFYFSGTEISKTGENTYSVDQGTFTSCKADVPAWSFKLGHAEIEVEGYARVRHAAMKVKKVPVLYLPYVVWPVRTERTSGFLVPNLGYSERRGPYLGLAYYQVLGQSYDTTFFVDLYGEEYLGFGNEVRYQPTEGTRGLLQAYTIRDPVDEEWRWKVDLEHETRDLPKGMRGVLKVQEFSDFDFFRDFERSVDRNTIRSLESRGFVSGNWGPHSLNILVNNRETFVSNGDTVTLQRLPEVEYLLRPTRLGRLPLRFGLETSVNYLGIDRGQDLDARYGRADLAPELTFAPRLAPWMSVSFDAGYRVTWYGDTVRRRASDNREEFTGETLTRSIPFGSALIVGPSFSRVFEAGRGGYAKFKHVIEPRWSYGYVDEYEDAELIPLFDEIDRIGSGNVGTFALVNRIKAKRRPKDPASGVDDGQVREIFSWEISRSYSFDDERPLQSAVVPVPPGGTGDGRIVRQAGPIRNLFQIRPTERTDLTARVDYDTIFSQMTSASLSGAVGVGRQTFSLSWRTAWAANTGEKTSDQVRLGTGLELLPGRLRLSTDMVYDIEQSLLQQQRYLIDFASQCYSFRLEWRDTQFGDEREKDLRLSLTLKNVGTFLDLTN